MARHLLLHLAMQILLADESRGVRAITRAALQQTSFGTGNVREVDGGVMLTNWIHTRAPGPALIIADWDLPGMNGLELLETLESLQMTGEVSVLFCVNRDQVALVRETGTRFLVRPFTDDQLRAALESASTRSSTPSDVFRDIVATVRTQQDLPSLLRLPSSVISELFRTSTRRRSPAGETLVWPGQQVDALTFIMAGEVEVHPANAAPYKRGTGDCFAERAFVCGEPARVTVVASSDAALVDVPKVHLVELARRHAAVRTFLSMLLQEPAAEEKSELNGSIESLPFADLLQFLNVSRKTGHLLLESQGVQGIIAFREGEAVDAAFAGKSGEAAFFELATWTAGRFDFRAGVPSGARTLLRSTMKLLMDAFARSAPALAG